MALPSVATTESLHSTSHPVQVLGMDIELCFVLCSQQQRNSLRASVCLGSRDSLTQIPVVSGSQLATGHRPPAPSQPRTRLDPCFLSASRHSLIAVCMPEHRSPGQVRKLYEYESDENSTITCQGRFRPRAYEHTQCLVNPTWGREQCNVVSSLPGFSEWSLSKTHFAGWPQRKSCHRSNGRSSAISISVLSTFD